MPAKKIEKEQDKFSSRRAHPVGLEPMGFLINLGRYELEILGLQ
ncbi:MAG TPA: hypothetical protein VF350_06015 [Candidatus Bathyarchaeia archaeon]